MGEFRSVVVSDGKAQEECSLLESHSVRLVTDAGDANPKRECLRRLRHLDAREARVRSGVQGSVSGSC